MTAPPPCPQPQDFSVLSGFITPGSDTTPHALDASIAVSVLDPTENNEPVRIVEPDDPWDLEVDWCVCGRFADMMVCGCWNVQVFIDDIDGVGPTHGLIDSTKVNVSEGKSTPGDDTSQKCFEHTFHFTAGSVEPGVYDLVVVITLMNTPSCDTPVDTPVRWVQDMLGYAQIPVLLFASNA
jgi:hypothetical protein